MAAAAARATRTRIRLLHIDLRKGDIRLNRPMCVFAFTYTHAHTHMRACASEARLLHVDIAQSTRPCTIATTCHHTHTSAAAAQTQLRPRRVVITALGRSGSTLLGTLFKSDNWGYYYE
jgi:hypothetical protein